MDRPSERDFPCPDCGARLMLVRIKAAPMTSDRAPCPACGSFLLPRDGDDLLQYKRATAGGT